MGVLERLEKEAREARQRRAAEAEAQRERDESTGARLAPAIERATRYLETMAAHLADLDRGIEARYEIDGIGSFEGLRQEAYRVTPLDEEARSVALRFTCTGPNPLEATVDGWPRAEAIGRRLREAGLRCHLQALGERRARLRVDAKVPVRIAFVPDTGQGRVLLELHNLAALGVERYPLAPERIDEPLLDAVGSLVLREPSDFAALTGSVVAADDRAGLKLRLARDARRREAELAGGLRRLALPIAEWLRRHFLGG